MSCLEFRAWDTVNEKILTFEDFTLKGSEDQGWLPCDLEGKPLTTKKEADTIRLLEYTGRKDRIGQKVFEGHLLKANSGDIFKVVFDPAHGGFRLQETEKKGPSLPWEPGSKMVIVGTVFEGEYLLREQQMDDDEYYRMQRERTNRFSLNRASKKKAVKPKVEEEKIPEPEKDETKIDPS